MSDSHGEDPQRASHLVRDDEELREAAPPE